MQPIDPVWHDEEMSERWGDSEPIDGYDCIGFRARKLYTYPCSDSR